MIKKLANSRKLFPKISDLNFTSQIYLKMFPLTDLKQTVNPTSGFGEAYKPVKDHLKESVCKALMKGISREAQVRKTN